MKQIDLKQTFHTQNIPKDKFLSRLFGIFNEEIVRIWTQLPNSPYSDLGRPTLRKIESERGHTLDFTFEDSRNGRRFVGEMKCEMQYENYKYLTLEDISQITHHQGKPAFRAFQEIAINKQSYIVNVGKLRKVHVDGSVLIWGRLGDMEKVEKVRQYYGFHQILSIENMIHELMEQDDPQYRHFIEEKQEWCEFLFNKLSGK